MRFIEWLLSWFRDLPGEDGYSNWIDDPHDERHDPQKITRILHDDEFLFLERPPK